MAAVPPVGLLAGDQFLEFAAKIAERLRSEDLFARFSGEEFVIAIRRVPTQSAVPMANEIRRIIEALHVSFASAVMSTTFSIGVATYEPSVVFATPDALVMAADEALHRAKELDRKRVELVTG